MKTAAEAALLVDDFVLAQGGVGSRNGHRDSSSAGDLWPASSGRLAGLRQGQEPRLREVDKSCANCHKWGHLKRNCFALKARSTQAEPSVSPKPAMLVAPVSQRESHVSCAKLKSFQPFISEGFVS